MNDDLERELMQSLRYSAGLDKEKLGELVRLATKLFDSIKNKDTKAAVGGSDYEWWWIYGQPAVEGIAFETILKHEQVQELVSAVSKMSDVRAVMSSLELTPGRAVKDPQPEPWKVKGAFGAKHGPGPPNPW